MTDYSNLSDSELLALKDRLEGQIVPYHNKQMSIKILMNSLYGATANIHFQYYILMMAQGITLSGQLAIQTAATAVNAYLNKVLKTDGVDYIIYIDTDSIYVNFNPLVEKAFGSEQVDRDKIEDFLDKVSKEKIQPVIANAYQEMADRLGAYENAMSMKREKICDKAIFVAKKRYILSVLNSENVHYDEPKISVTGIESVRSSTPEVCREAMKKAFKIIMKGKEAQAQEFIENFRKEFYNMPPEDVAKNSGTEDIEKYMDPKTLYKKGCPAHVRGAILFNAEIEKRGLVKYSPITSGDKIKFVYLRIPNPIKENIISFDGVLPRELNLHDYIDYPTQFEKVFLKPLETIVNAIGWSSKRQDSLDDFFV